MTAPIAPRARGQTLTEFALVLPIALILVMATFDFGRALFYLNSVSEAARNGSRIALVNQDAGYICATVAAEATGLNLPPGCVAPATSPGVTHQSDCADLDCQQTVIVKMQFLPIMPVIGGMVGPINLSSESSTNIERVCPAPCAP